MEEGDEEGPGYSVPDIRYPEGFFVSVIFDLIFFTRCSESLLPPVTSCVKRLPSPDEALCVGTQSKLL